MTAAPSTETTDRAAVAAAGFFAMVSRAVFTAIAVILMVLAIVLAGDAMVECALAFWRGDDVGAAALAGIGYSVVAIATFEIAKYLFEEEVLRGSEKRVAAEARRSLTRFISTIAIAIFLEALVIVFRVGKDQVPYLIYPTLLLVAGIVVVIGLGVYQRLSAEVEDAVEARDAEDEDGGTVETAQAPDAPSPSAAARVSRRTGDGRPTRRSGPGP
ncbi:GNAT family acetyltransferase [Rhodoplanes elegans]|uniref:GNAT family acetyltransferase n=2 Tax=Rhodoplanes elegans TaxID=29408 RepID=UPI001AECFA9C|nr:GNAT family acetyltransferase [Rhodoplanes elegans]